MKRHLPRALVALFAASLLAADEPPRAKDGPAPSADRLRALHAREPDHFPAPRQRHHAGRDLFLTLQEAMEQKKVVVHETSDVNELSIENVSADVDVFVQSGDIVRGGKQDRLMATDMIVPPKSGRIAIPSFCCEAGRWQKRGAESAAAFGRSDTQAGNKDLKLAVNAARDQGRVWEEVKKAQMKLSANVGKQVASPQSPSSYQLALEDKDLLAKIDAYTKELTKAIDGKDDAIGIAIAINGKVEGADVYGSAALIPQALAETVEGRGHRRAGRVQQGQKVRGAREQGRGEIPGRRSRGSAQGRGAGDGG